MTDRPTASTINDAQLDALYDQLAALRQVARGYCPACGRGDAAPTVEDWEAERRRADKAEAVVAMVTANATEWAKHEAADDPIAAAIAAAGRFLLTAIPLTTRYHRPAAALDEPTAGPSLREQVTALRDDLRGITGARWIADALDNILDGQPADLHQREPS